MHYILMQQSVSEAVPVVKNIMGVFRGEDILIQAVNIFHWGYIQGIRAERAKRKRVVFNISSIPNANNKKKAARVDARATP